MAVRILVDSSTDLRKELQEEPITVPLIVRFGSEELLHGVELKNDAFYRRLEEAEELPTTSQPTPDTFAKVFRELTAQGDTVVALTLSSRLSGTYQSARLGARGMEESVFVVDTQNVAIGAGILAEYALALAKEGKSGEEIARAVEEKRSRVKLFAVVDTLEYLKKGGRLSSAAAFAGGLLNIKPLITLEDGAVAVAGKGRGFRQACRLFSQEVERVGVDFSLPILFGYTGNSDEALQKGLEETAVLWEPLEEPCVAMVGSVVGTHVGPGAMAVAFFAKE